MRDLNHISHDAIALYIKGLEAKGYSKQEIATKLRNIDRFMQWAYDKDHLQYSRYQQLKDEIAKYSQIFASSAGFSPAEDQSRAVSSTWASPINGRAPPVESTQDRQDGHIVDVKPEGQHTIRQNGDNYGILDSLIYVFVSIPLLNKLPFVQKTMKRTDIPVLGPTSAWPQEEEQHEDESSTSLLSYIQQRPVFIIGGFMTLLVLSLLTYGIYDRFFKTTETTQAYPATPTFTSTRVLSFQGRLTDNLGNPITASTNMRFRLYDASVAGTTLYDSGTCAIAPDQDGVHNVLIGSDCGSGIASSIFTENTEVWLGVTVGSDSEMTPRQQVANVPYALNAETLQGLPPGTSASSVAYINQGGDLLIGAASPQIGSTFASQTFVVSSANALTLQSASTGDITLLASGSGQLVMQASGDTDDFIYLATDSNNAQLLFEGYTANDPGVRLNSATNQLEYRDENESSWTAFDTSGISYWQLNSNVLSPGGSATVTDKLVLGGNTTTNHQFDVSGAITGKALVLFDEEGNQNILTASSSGTTRLNLTNAGQVELKADGSTAGITIGAGDDIALYHDGTDSILSTSTGDWVFTAADDFRFTDNQVTNIQLSDVDSSLPNSNTGIVDAINDAYNAAVGSSGGLWTDSGTTTYLTATTDELVLGGSTPLSSAKFSIDGDADQIQLIVQGNGTQTTSLAVFENSTGTDVFTISNAGDIVVAGTTDAQGSIANSTGNVVVADTVDLGSASTGLRIDTSGVVLDIDGNIVLNDQVDIGSATTGIRVATTGSMSDIDGNLVLADTVDIGSATTGIRVATTGSLLDIDGNLVLNDQTDIGSATTGIRVATSGSLLDIDGNLVLNDQTDIGSATTGIRVTTAGAISDIDGNISLVDNTDITGDLTNTGNTTFGDAGADTVLSNAATWTFANDTSVVLSGGVNGLNFDSNTLSIDAANDRIGIGTAAPDAAWIDIAAATTSKAQLNLTSSAGTNVSSPNSGDLWWNGTELYFYNGSTNTDLLSSGTASPWTDSGTTVYLTDTTDELVLGGSSPLSSGKFSIDGDADQIQMVIQGNGTQTANLLEFQNSGGTVLTVIDENGNLGIGTSTPAVPVQVIRTPVVDGDNRVLWDAIDDSAMAADVGAGINFGGKYTAGGSIAGWAGIAGYKENGTSGNYAGYLTLMTRENGGNTTSRLTINSTGNVLVNGFTSSTVGLTVKGAASQTAHLSEWQNSSGTDLSWIDESGNLRIGTSATDNGKLNVTGAYTGKALSIFNETGNQAILTASASGTERFTVENNGNVTFNPSAFGSAITLYDVDTTLPNSNTGIVDAINDAYNAAIGGGGGLWSDSGTTTYLSTTTDDLVLGATSPANGAKLTIDGDADQVQLEVYSHSTQSNDLARFYNTGGSNVARITSSGQFIASNSGFSVALSSGYGIYYQPSNRVYLAKASNNAIGVGSSDIEFNLGLSFPSDTAVSLGGGVDALNFDSNTLSIDATGDKVGIGTAAPTGKLHVEGAVTGKALAIFNETGNQDIFAASASGTTRFRVANDGGIYGGYWVDISNNQYGLDPAGTTNFGNHSLRITGGALLAEDSGQVGINTTTTNASLDVGGGTANFIDGTDDILVADDVEIDGDLYVAGGIDTAFTQGSVVFAGASGLLTEDNTNFFWDDSSNELGIGTTSPAATLDVLDTTEQLRLSYDVSNTTSFTVSSGGDLTLAPSGGDTSITGTLDVSTWAGIGPNASPTSNTLLTTQYTGFDTSSTSGYGIYNYLQGTGAGGNTLNGIYTTVNNVLTGTSGMTVRGEYAALANSQTTLNSPAYYGDYKKISNNVAATINEIYGYTTELQNNSTGTVGGAAVVSFDSQIQNNSTGTMSNVRHFRANSPTNSGTIGTIYGLIVGDQAVGTTTNAYGVYIGAQSGASGDNIGLYIGDADDYSLQLASTDGDAASGITFGTDTNLYRSAANTLYTDDAFTAVGNITTSGDLAVNGDDITSDGNLTLNATGYTRIGDTATPGSANGDDDLFVEGDLEIDGIFYLDGTLDTTFTAGSVVFAGTNGVLAQDNASFYWDDSSNELGIGTTAPAATLDVLDTTEQLRLSYDASNYTSFTVSSGGDLTLAPSGGDTNITGNLDVSTWSAFGPNASATTNTLLNLAYTSMDTTSSSGYGINNTITDTSAGGNGINGLYQTITNSMTGASAVSVRGEYTAITNNSTTLNANSTYYGDYKKISNNVAATLNQISGYTTELENNSTGFLAGSIKSYDSNIENNSTGTMNNVYHFVANSPANASGTINNIYGLIVGDQAVGTTTNAYGVYIGSQSGASGDNIGLYIADADDYSLQLASTDGDAASGITFGTDTNLYRSAANTLHTDDAFDVGSTLTAATGDAFYVNSEGHIEVGNPSGTFVDGNWDALIGSGSNAGIKLINTDASSATEGAGFILYSYDGAAMASGDRLGFNLFGGGTGSGTTAHGGGIVAYADGAWGASSAPTRLEFEVAPTGSTSRTTAMVIKENGDIGIGTSGPDAQLDSLSTAGEQLRLTYTDGSAYTGFTTSSGGDLTIDPTGGDIIVDANFLPNTDDTYDLGSNTARWQDLYLGPQTLHIGTSTTDEGTIGYTTSTNTLTFTNNYGDTDFTTSSDGFNFTLGGGAGDDFIVDTSTLVVESDNDRVGIGVTAPDATWLDIAAATTAKAQINLTSSVGVNVTTPNSGDLWWNGTNLYFYNGSTNKDLLAAGGSSPWTDGGSYVYTTAGEVLNLGGVTGTAYHAISDSGTTSHSLNSDDDLFVEGDFEVDGSTFIDGSLTLGNSSAFNGAGLSDCDSSTSILLWDSATGLFSCGKDNDLFTVHWTDTNMPANVIASQLDRPISTIIPGAASEIRMPYAGNVVGMSVTSSVARTAGAASFEVFINGATTGFTCTLDATNTQYNTCTQTSGTSTFTAGDLIDVRVSSTAWANSTTEMAVEVWFEMDSGADVAEMYNTKDLSIVPGEIVSLDSSIKEGIKKSDSPYDNGTIGVIATKPGVLLGMEEIIDISMARAVALSGRVPVKVTSENGPIHIGDAITSSSIPGVGMKSTKAARVVGRAMTEWTSSNPHEIGTVTIFVEPAYDAGYILTEAKKLIKDAQEVIVADSITVKNLVANSIKATTATIDNLIVNRFTSQEATITDADIERLNAEAIKAQEIEAERLAAEEAEIEKLTSSDITSGSLSAENAKISGTLVADNIDSQNVRDLRDRLEKLAADQSDVVVDSETLESEVSEIQGYITQLTNKETPEDIADTAAYQIIDSDIALDPGTSESVLGNTITTANLESLMVTGEASMTTLAVADAFSAGEVFIKDNSVISLNNELKLSALEKIDLMNGGVIITADGSITAKGEVIAQKGVRSNSLRPLENGDDISVILDQREESTFSLTDPSSTDTHITNSEFKIENTSGQKVASIDAEGSARFKDLSLDTYTEATTSAVVIAASDNYKQNGIYTPAIKTNAAASGNGILPEGENDIIIYNNSIKKNTVVNLTATSSSRNKALYVDKIESCENSANEKCTPYFRVAIDDDVDIDITFNWLIVN